MTPLRVLLIEDSEDDARSVTRALRQTGYDVAAERVDTAAALREALKAGVWDLAIADYTLPAISGAKALSIVREHGVDVPFIFISETTGEEVAVGALKTGAHDYILKHNLARLAPAVKRELREAAARRERNRVSDRVAYMAYHDPLTDLPNRALLHDRLQQAIRTSRRDHTQLALLVLDLDGFKEVNDTLGHAAGDRVLQQVAARLPGTLRASDTVARLGGDEFAMVLPATDLDGAELTARKVLQSLEQPFLVEGRPLNVRASIGIAGAPLHASESDELLQKADAAMYLAKRDRSGCAVYSADRDQHTEQRLGLMNALRNGIWAKEFLLDYQPVVHLRSATVVGVEALLRWNHPEQGRLLPKDFIQLAEQADLISPLTSFAIDRVLTEWPDAGRQQPFTIAVNLSPRNLRDTLFPGRIREMLDAHRTTPSSLAVEVTENVIMSDVGRSARCLSELRDLGIRVVVNDFGAGFTSLGYLRRLPIDELKIDKSLVKGLADDDALVRSIIDLAHNLRLSVVAEGVETEAVRDRLLALGCDAAQGPFISEPGPASEIAQWIERRAERSVVRRK